MLPPDRAGLVDPRFEDRRAIREAIADGARSASAVDGDTLLVIDDRRAAIGHAIGLAARGDMLLPAGKGHETSMFVRGRTLGWDDRKEACAALRNAGWGADGC